MSWWDKVESSDTASASAVSPITQLLDLLESGKLMQYATTSHLHLRLVVCVLFNTHTKNKALILPEAQTCRSLRSETCSVALQSNDSDVLTIWLNCLYIYTNPNKDGIHRIFLLVACSSVTTKQAAKWTWKWLQWFCCNSEYRQKTPVLLVHVYYKAVTWQKVIKLCFVL